MKRRRLIIVRVGISSEKKYMLAYQIESRSGFMYKHLPGAQPFGDQQLPEAQACIGKVTDLRIKAKADDPEQYHQFLEDTVDDAEYNAYLEHIHTPRASDY